MKKIIFIIVLFLVIIGIGYKLSSSFSLLGAAAKSQEIVVTDKGFQPAMVTVKQNTKVIFVNKGTKPHWPASDFHPTHGIYPEFDPREGIPPGGKWEFVFAKIGKWRYHDHLEPENKGRIIVD